MLQFSLVLDPNQDVSEGLRFINTLLTLQSVLTVSDPVLQCGFMTVTASLFLHTKLSPSVSPLCLLCCLYSFALLSLREADEQLVGTVLSVSKAELFGTAGQTTDNK